MLQRGQGADDQRHDDPGEHDKYKAREAKGQGPKGGVAERTALSGDAPPSTDRDVRRHGLLSAAQNRDDRTLRGHVRRHDPEPLHTGLPSGPATCFQLCSTAPTTLSGIGT